jgi:uncharacterized protein (DUF2225 family)
MNQNYQQRFFKTDNERILSKEILFFIRFKQIYSYF